MPDTAAPTEPPVDIVTVTPETAVDEETITSAPAPEAAFEPAPSRRLDDKGHGTDEMAPDKNFLIDALSALPWRDESDGAVEPDTASADTDSSAVDAAAWVEPTAPPPIDDDVEMEILFATVDPSEAPATQDATAARESAETPEIATPETTSALAPASVEDDAGVEDEPKAEAGETVGDEPAADDDVATTAEHEIADSAATGGADEVTGPAAQTNLGSSEGDRSDNVSGANYNIMDWGFSITVDTDSTSDDIEINR